MKSRVAKRKRYKKKKKSKINIDIAVVGMIVASILLAVLIYTQSGYLGKNLSPMLGGLIGSIKYIIPIGTFLIAIHLACDDKDYLGTKLVQYVVFLICVCIIMSVYELSRGNLNINDEFSDVISQAYLLGEKNIGGGAVGALVTIPLAKLLGTLGAVILAVGMAIMLLVFMFGIKPAELIASFVEEVQQRREDRLEEEEEEEEEEAEEIVVDQSPKKIKKRSQKKLNKKQKKSSIDIPLDDETVIPEIEDGQITIHNLGVEEKKKERKNHRNNEEVVDSVVEKTQPDVIEANLFATEQETKEEKTKEVLKLEHTLTVEDENYEFPPIQLLAKGETKTIRGGKKAITDNATRLQKTLYSFGVSAKVENVSVGPAITRYELKPAEGVRVSKIANLADDIALNLAAESIRIEAPIPGKQAVGIEVPNKENEVVHLRDILDTQEFAESNSKLAVGLGKDVAGNVVVTDIAKMPHLLVAGSTGSRKKCMY